MPSTRSGAQSVDPSYDREKEIVSQAAGSKRKQPIKASSDDDSEKNPHAGAAQAESSKAITTANEEGPQQPPTKAPKQGEPASKNLDQDKLNKLLESQGIFPLSDCGLKEPEKATSQTVLAHLFNAMLTSARISHELAAKSVKCLIEAGYHDIDTLKKSSWEERTEVLTKGGYTRYREKTATGLGELADFLDSKYQDDLNKLREAANDDSGKARELIKEVKGLGEVGVNIFHDTMQALWPFMAPFVDPRSLDTAEELGVGQDVQAMWQGVEKDAKKMARLCVALTTVRLEKKQDEFTDEDDGGEEG